MDERATLAGVQREQEMKFGTQITDRGVRFRLWAPFVESVSLRLEMPERNIPMMSLARGWFETEVDNVEPGALYRFVMDGGTVAPDPASRFQPFDVDGPSEVIDPRAFAWSDGGWRGRPWEETIFYQLHIGTFTQEGTFLAAIEKLDHLVSLGITAIQLMPLADFKGRWNWGYDGALLFAPDSSYGRPEHLKAFIDAAHARKLMVFLDVVYNHFGPKGNYLAVYAPALTEAHETPWGPAVNYDDEGSAMIRDFVMANARYWLNEFHFDGLRFDAVHAIADEGPKHMLQDLAEQIRTSTDGRHVHLVAENSENQAGWLKRLEDGRPQFYTAQWDDDLHHSLHAIVTGEHFWYYADFADRIDLVARASAEGFAWQGEFMENEGAPKGEPSAFLPATAFVSYVQNHDQVGNRPLGDRITQIAPRAAVHALAAINLLSPHIPLLFMGEEWAAEQPFLFFSDLGEDLADTIRQSRKEELKDAPAHGQTPPDPMAEETFRASKLNWDSGDHESEDHLAFYRRLIKLRQEQIVPRLFGLAGDSSRYQVLGPKTVRISWTLADGATLCLVANLGAEAFSDPSIAGEDHLWLEGSATDHGLGPWSVLFTLSPRSVS